MQKTHAILKALNELLENKETYSTADYEKKLLDLIKEIDQQLLSAKYKKATEKEQKLILEQYKGLLKMG